MSLLSLVLLASTALTATVALKQPLLCTNNKGNWLVCTIIDSVNTKTSSQFSLDKSNITVAKNGQDFLFDVLESLSILTKSTSKYINYVRESINAVDPPVGRSVDKTIKQIGNIGFASRNLLYTAITSIRRFEAALKESHIRNADRTFQQSGNAMKGLKHEEDQQIVRDMSFNHFSDLKRCSKNFEQELESLQNKTRLLVESFYNTGIDILDHLGKCYESSHNTFLYGSECVSKGLKLLAKFNQSPVRFSIAALKFTAIEKKSFDQYLCTRKAVADYSLRLQKFSRKAETTTTAPVTSLSSMSTKIGGSSRDSSSSLAPMTTETATSPSSMSTKTSTGGSSAGSSQPLAPTSTETTTVYLETPSNVTMPI